SIMCVTFSWRASCGKVSLYFALNFFVASDPRKPFTRFRTEPFRGERPAVRFYSIMCVTFSRRAYRGNLSLYFALKLFVVRFFRNGFALFCAQLFRSERAAESFHSIFPQTFLRYTHRRISQLDLRTLAQ